LTADKVIKTEKRKINMKAEFVIELERIEDEINYEELYEYFQNLEKENE